MSIKIKNARDCTKKFIGNVYFENFITIAICLNTVVMAMNHFNMNKQFEDILTIFNTCFMVIFTLEAILKLHAMRCDYFYDKWNIFDFFIVVTTLLFLVLTALDFVEDLASLSMVLRILRIGRLLRLIKRAKTL